MILVLKLLLWCGVIGISFARKEAELKAWFVNLGIECSTDYPITTDELKMMELHKLPSSKNAKCLTACVFRKAGWMDNKGMFDVKSASEMIEKEHIDDVKKIENSKKLFDSCKKVNDEAVSDGESGCERATLLAKCLIEMSPKMGFKLE